MYRRDSCVFSFASVFLQMSSAHAHARFSAEHDMRSDRGNRKLFTHTADYGIVSLPPVFAYITGSDRHDG